MIRRGASIDFNFDLEQMIRTLQEEAWATPMTNPTVRLPFPYLRVAGRLRMLAAKLLHLRQRLFRARQDPGWPIAPSLDLLIELAARRRPPLWDPSFWAAALTVDVDTVKGLRHAPKVADAIEKAGFRACFYIVGSALRCEPVIARELHARGHEIGSHDVQHDNRICFVSSAQREERLREARGLIEPFGGVGFRSPSALRTPELIGAVARYFDYDSSICDTDLEHARGCTTVFPYRLHGCLEIPFTLPMDASLAYVGYSARAALDIWRSKCAYIRALKGLAMLVIHAEPHLACGKRFNAFRCFLAWLHEQPDVEVVLPSELARRWRLQEQDTRRGSVDSEPATVAPPVPKQRLVVTTH